MAEGCVVHNLGVVINEQVMSYMMQLLIYLLLIVYEIGLFCTSMRLRAYKLDKMWSLAGENSIAKTRYVHLRRSHH